MVIVDILISFLVSFLSTQPVKVKPTFALTKQRPEPGRTYPRPSRYRARYQALVGQVWREQECWPRSAAQNCIVLKHHEISDSAVTLHYCQLSARYRPNVAHKSASIHSLFVPSKSPKSGNCCASLTTGMYVIADVISMFLFNRMDFSVFQSLLRAISGFKI